MRSCLRMMVRFGAVVTAAVSVAPASAEELAIPAIFDAVGHFNERIAPALADGRWGFIDADGEWIVEPRFERVMRGTEGLFAVREDDRWGFIDSGGVIRIAPDYDDVEPFSDGFAAARRDDRWFFIDRNGKQLWESDFISASSFVDGLALVAVRGESGGVSVRLIDPDGRSQFSPVEFERLTPDDRLTLARSQDDYAVVGVNDAYWLAQLSVWPMGPFLEWLSDEVLAGGGFTPGGHFYCRRQDGGWTIQNLDWIEIFNGIGVPNSDLAEQLRFSIVNCYPEVALTGQLESIGGAGMGLIAVEDGDDDWIYLDEDLGGVFSSAYWDIDRFYGFHEGYALYRDADDRFGFLELGDDGEIVIKTEAIYDDAFRVREGLAPVQIDGKWGFVRFGDPQGLIERPLVGLSP